MTAMLTWSWNSSDAALNTVTFDTGKGSIYIYSNSEGYENFALMAVDDTTEELV